MIDLFYIIHYIVYRFYRKHGESFGMSMCYTCGLHSILSFTFLGSIDYFTCLLLEIPFHISKSFWGVYLIFCVIFYYFVFFRNDRYIDVFIEYIKQSDMPEMKAKFKQAKIFNYSLFAIDLLLLIIADYLNNQK